MQMLLHKNLARHIFAMKIESNIFNQHTFLNCQNILFSQINLSYYYHLNQILSSSKFFKQLWLINVNFIAFNPQILSFIYIRLGPNKVKILGII